MGDEPPHPSRADWLTGSALNTVPGRVSFAHYGIPGPYMARRGGVQSVQQMVAQDDSLDDAAAAPAAPVALDSDDTHLEARGPPRKIGSTVA